MPKWCNTCWPKWRHRVATHCFHHPRPVPRSFSSSLSGGTCSLAVRLGISRVYLQRLRNAPPSSVCISFWPHAMAFSFPTVFIVIQLSTAVIFFFSSSSFFLYSLFIQVSTHLPYPPTIPLTCYACKSLWHILLGHTRTHTLTLQLSSLFGSDI